MYVFKTSSSILIFTVHANTSGRLSRGPNEYCGRQISETVALDSGKIRYRRAFKLNIRPYIDSAGSKLCHQAEFIDVIHGKRAGDYLSQMQKDCLWVRCFSGREIGTRFANNVAKQISLVG
jgi:hypothetical protein